MAGALRPQDGDNKPVLMGLIENTEGPHERAINVGSADRLVLEDDGLWHAYGTWSTDPAIAPIRQRVRDKHNTGISVELADVQFQYLFPAEQLAELEPLADEGEEVEDEELPTENIDGVDYVTVDIPQERMRVISGVITGMSIVPTPSFHEGWIEDLDPDSPLTGLAADAEALVAAATAPVKPPKAWFEPLDPALGAFDVEITDEGEVFGYPAATWDTCHLSFADSCVTPPRSECDYALFKGGNTPVAEGGKVRTGCLTLKGGHADKTWSMAKAMAHYDDTDSAFADVNIGENEHGIWIHGALRPNLTPEAVRVAMSSGFSGDWRWDGGNHELIALSAVNTRGFVNRVQTYETDGLVASMIVDLPRCDCADTPVDTDALVASARERIAASIGRSTEQRIAELAARVHG
jgi:hypothetical protein